MWQAEIRVDLGAIRSNVALLCAATSAEVMAVVKADGYGHGMVPAARAALRGGATWLGVATLGEALELRAAGLAAPVLAWLLAPGLPLHEAVAADVDLSAGSVGLLDEIVTAARQVGRPARTHLKIDTGLARGGATAADWPGLCEAAAKAQASGDLEVVGVWSHLVYADVPDHPTTDHQLAAFAQGLARAAALGITPAYRHLANSAATLTRPDTHFELVRPGIAVYGLSPIPGRDFGLRPAMTARARVTLTKRVGPGQGVSYGHSYVTSSETTLAVIPVGYADGIPRAAGGGAQAHRGAGGGVEACPAAGGVAAGGVARVWLAGANRPIAGRVCMDQFVIDCGDADVSAGDIAVLCGPGDAGEPTADDWAAAAGTISYEIVAKLGSSRIPRVYDDADDEVSR